MLRDHATPRLPTMPTVRDVEGVEPPHGEAAWNEPSLDALLSHLRGVGRTALRRLTDDALIAAWETTVAEFLDPDSPARRRLDPAWIRGCGLSPAGLQAAVEAVLGGVRGEPLRRLVREARPATDGSLVCVILSGNLPALAVQPLLPTLAVRRPAILKSPSAEPFFAPAFVERLGTHQPLLRDAIAALSWKGGESAIEDRVLQAAGRILAYGEDETMARLRRTVGDRLVAYGPKISLAIVEDGRNRDVTAGLARDIALFDQRGCLSVHAIYTSGDAHRLAQYVADELVALAGRWPPGPASAGQLAAVQQVRADAALRNLVAPPMPVPAGTVIVETEPALQISPGLRTVRIHAVASTADVAGLLAPWKGRLQGVALERDPQGELESALRRLGVSRIAPPGELQSPDALWHNGGMNPLTAVGDRGDGTTPYADPVVS